MLKRTAAVASLVALAFAAAAYAGNGGNKSSSSYISAPVLVSSGTLAPTTSSGPHWNNTITFNTSTTETDNPFVNVTCYQNGTLVLNSWDAYFTGSLYENFVLSSGVWTGGAADCTANLDMYRNGNWKVLASTSFHANA